MCSTISTAKQYSQDSHLGLTPQSVPQQDNLTVLVTYGYILI